MFFVMDLKEKFCNGFEGEILRLGTKKYLLRKK